MRLVSFREQDDASEGRRCDRSQSNIPRLIRSDWENDCGNEQCDGEVDYLHDGWSTITHNNITYLHDSPQQQFRRYFNVYVIYDIPHFRTHERLTNTKQNICVSRLRSQTSKPI
jgi:hypothetical protein